MKKERTAKLTRNTKETQIEAELNIDGTGKSNVDTGIGFFNHMLEGFAKHGFFDLNISICGDLYVDGHHTVEDGGIVIGQAIREALGDKKGIKRYGNFILPMDDALALCAVDLCGRPYLKFDCEFDHEMVGDLDTSLVKEFFYALSYKVIHGENDHHIIEAIFKAFAKALDEAVSYDERIADVLSTKGSL